MSVDDGALGVGWIVTKQDLGDFLFALLLLLF